MSDVRDDDQPIEPNDPLTADGFDEDAGGGNEEGLAASSDRIFDTGGNDETDTDEAVERRPDGEMGME